MPPFVARHHQVPARPGPAIVVHARSDSGHRPAYLAVLARYFDLERLPLGLRLATSRKPVLFTMVEEAFAAYALIATIRALFRRRTVGVLFRPLPALTGTTPRLRLKRFVLKALRRLPHVQTLTLLPFTLEPRFTEIADSWLYDLQLWDLTDEPIQHDERLTATIRERAGNRPIIIALGRQDRDKAFDTFANCLPTDSALLACGGPVSPDLATHREAFKQNGGFLLDRLLSDPELFAFYAAADRVWCAYAPDYDQASGILGRAAQLGIPVIVRPGSLLHKLCIAHLPFSGNPADLTAPVSLQPSPTRTRRFAETSLRHLTAALGLAS